MVHEQKKTSFMNHFFAAVSFLPSKEKVKERLPLTVISTGMPATLVMLFSSSCLYVKLKSSVSSDFKPNEKYKSLFRVILDASVEGGLKAYDKIDFDIQPKYDNPIPQDSLKNRFVTCDWNTANNTPRISSLIEKDPLTNQNKVSSYYYEDYASKQMKFIIQEIIFFNKHYSRMFTKIIGIAPVYVYNETNVTNLNMTGINKSGESVWNFLQSSVTCWYLFDELRPFLAKQYMVPNGNDTERLTFDEFFSQKLYSSYLLGDSNMFNRMLLQAYNEPEQILKEQKRIETELLNVEQDIWEY
jgi:hypothetical protein